MTDSRSDLALLHRRAGFGATAQELDASQARGFTATVELLVSGLGNAPDPAGNAVTPPTFPKFVPGNGGRNARRRDLPSTPSTTGPSAEQRATNMARRQADRLVIAQLQKWWLARMSVTSTPLREKLVLFWSGHFATSYTKVQRSDFMYRQNETFRTLGAGSFTDLVQAIAKDPAMMIWLDTRTDLSGHPNENFARELMELFTLGVGNYSQHDVTQAARAFTGWSFNPTSGEFMLRRRQHDAGTKSFLGHTGNFDGTDIVNIICNESASARFVTAKLFSHLAYPIEPTDPIVSELIDSYGANHDLTALTRAIFLHPAFRSDAARYGLVKQPIEYVVGAARALGIDPGADFEPRNPQATQGNAKRRPLLAMAATMLTQIPFAPPNVGGWPQNGYWINTATALARMRVAELLVNHAEISKIVQTPRRQRVDAVSNLLSIESWSTSTMAALNEASRRPRDLLVAALISPEYVLN